MIGSLLNFCFSIFTYTVGQELLSNLAFEDFGSCGDLVSFGGFGSVFECSAGDGFGEKVKAA